MSDPRRHYLSAATLTEQLHLSKLTVARLEQSDQLHHSDYDVAVDTLEEPVEEVERIGRESRAHRLRHHHVGLAKRLGLKPRLTPRPDLVEEVIVRFYPTMPRGRAGRPQNHFPPFSHHVGHNRRTVMTVAVEEHQPRPAMTDKLAEAMLLLCDRMSLKGNFRGYSYRDEMICDAMAQLLTAIFKFNESKSDNIFAYATQTANNAFIRRLNIERKQRDIRDDLLEMSGADASSTRQTENDLARRA